MYLFVDAAYLRRLMQDRLDKYLGAEVNVAWWAVRDHFKATRVFLYDAIDDVPRPGEDPTDLDVRVQAQEKKLGTIASYDGFFVRRGSLRGEGRKRRQKEVDVLLAVDMLSHSHRRNSDRMTLLAGDLDFRPLVEAVVDQGTIVTVACDSRGSRDLAHSADSQRLLTLQELWAISDGRVNDRACAVYPQVMQHEPPAAREEAGGKIGGIPVRLLMAPGKWIFDVDRFGLSNRAPRYFALADRDKLLEFIEADFGTIKWDEALSSA